MAWPDSAETDDGDSTVAEFALKALVVAPLAPSLALPADVQVTHEDEDGSDHLLGNGRSANARRVRDGDPSILHRFKREVANARRGTREQFHPVGVLQQLLAKAVAGDDWGFAHQVAFLFGSRRTNHLVIRQPLANFRRE
jgi:hypothetical protein